MMKNFFLSSAQELDGIPIDVLVNDGIESLNKHPNKIQVLEFLLNVVPKTANINVLDERVSRLILPEVLKFIEECITTTSNVGISNTEIVCMLDSMSSTVKLVYNLLEFIVSQLCQTSLQKNPTLVIAILKVLQTVYAFCKTRSCSNERSDDIVAAFKTLFCDCKRLQTALLAALVPENMKPSDANYLDFILQVMQSLCRTVVEITQLDVRSTAEMWKSLMKLSTDNASMLIANRVHRKDGLDWLAEAVSFLSSEILLIVEKIVEQNSSSLAVAGDFERHLKIISFYVKLLLRFANDYEDVTFWKHLRIFDALLGLTKCKYLMQSKISNNTCLQLSADVQNWLSAFYKGELLLNFLSEKHADKTALSRLMVCVQIIERIIQSDGDVGVIASIYLDPDYNLLCVISKCVLDGALDDVDNNCSMYSQLVASMTALIVFLCRHDPGRNEFFDNSLVLWTMQHNILLLVLALDVYTLWKRYHTHDSCKSYISFWESLSKSPSILSHRPTDVFVNITLQNLYDIQQTRTPATKSAISNRIQIEESEAAWRKCTAEPTSTNYYAMIERISLLSSARQSGSEDLLVKWIAIDESTIHVALSITFLRLARSCVLPLEYHQKILTKVCRMYDRKPLSSSAKIEIIMYLSSCISQLNTRNDSKCSDDCTRMITSLLDRLHSDADVVVSVECAITLAQFMLCAKTNPICVYLLDYCSAGLKSEITALLGSTYGAINHLKISSGLVVRHHHKCEVKNFKANSGDGGSERKKFKLEFEFEDDATELVTKLEQDAKALIGLHRGDLSSDNIRDIHKIANILMTIK